VALAALVVTCDPGVDDAIALAVAAGRPDCRVAAIVAGAGNIGAPTAWRNAVGMAALLGLDGPVGIGSERTIGGTPIRRSGDAHGADGLLGLADRLPGPAMTPADNIRLPAAGAAEPPPAPATRPTDGLPLVRGDVVALGPLTDLARALRAGQPVDRVVWMGGATDAGAAEFNASADAGAVDAVLDSRVAVAVVPIEITRRVVLGDQDLARWTAGSATSRLCADLAARRRERTPDASGVAIHDAVAVIAALEPDLFSWSPRRLTAGPPGAAAAGHLSSLPGPPNAQLAVAVDPAAVRQRIVDAVDAAPAARSDTGSRR
jgi:pyrimidine-specific ribonucleoside hydrolase